MSAVVDGPGRHRPQPAPEAVLAYLESQGLEQPRLLSEIRKRFPDEITGSRATGAGMKERRDCKYDRMVADGLLDLAYKYCLLGATNQDLARLFGIDPSTLCQWISGRPGFADALQAGRDIADANVARGLYRRAIGYSYSTTKIFMTKTGDVVSVPFTVHLPPDTAACTAWLRCRSREKWQPAGTDGPDGQPIVPPVIIVNPVRVQVQVVQG